MDNKVFVDDENVTTIEVDPQACDNTVPSDPPPSYNECKNFNTNNPNGTEPNGIEPHETKQNGTKQNGATSTGVDTFQVEPKPNGTADDGDKDEKKDDAKVEVKMVSVATLFRYATKMDILLMILGTLCSCAHGAALPGLLIVFGEMTDSFVYVAKSDVAASLNVTLSPAELESIGTSSLLDQMSEYAVYYTIMGVGVIFVAFGQVTFWLMASYRQCQRLRLTLFRCIMKQNIGWFDTHEAGELSTRLADDVNKVQEGIGDKIGNFFQWFSTFLAGFIIGFIYGWKLTLVILAVSPLLAISGGMMTKMMTDFTNSEMSAYAKAGAVAEEVFSSIRTVTAFGGQKKECERYGKNLVDAYKYGVKKSMVSGGGMGIVFLIIFCVYALAFWYGSKLVREDEAYTAGRVLIVFFCVLIGAFALGNAAPNLQNFAAARGSAHSLFEIIDTQPPIDSSSTEGEKLSNLTGNIEFKDVIFRYPARPEVVVLKGLNLKVNVGQTVALVGASGCGKSTTVALLQRFYDVESGSVSVDGKDIRDLNVKWFRENIGIVSQEPILFATTIEENIRYGRLDVTNDEIIRAAKEANAHDFISKLPQNYNTMVGERGAQLSGGQKQRIAIARALVRDPKILLLDEATSALDTESEATVQAALDKVRMGRTTIVIAHRLSTVRTADVIAGFKDGVIVEQGTHDELMTQGGVYYELVTRQTAKGATEDAEADDVNFEMEKRPGSMRKRNRTFSVTSEKSNTSKKDKEEEEDLPEASTMRIMKLNSPEWAYILFGCISAIINGAQQPLFAILFAEILGVYANPDFEEQKKKANFYSLMFLVLGVISAAANFFQAFLFGKSGEALTMRVRGLAFRGYLRQDISFFDDSKNSTGALTTRLATDAASLQGATGVRLGTVCQSLASIGTGIIIGFIYSWKLTLGILAFVPFILIAGVLQMKILKGFSSEGKEALEDAGKTATEAIDNIRTVASLTREDKFYEIYASKASKPHKNNMRKSIVTGITFSFSQALIYFAYAACFYLGAYLVENDGLSFDNMFKVFSAIVFGAMAMGNASQFTPDYGKAKISAARLFALIDSEPTIDSFSEEGEKPGSLTGEVKFNEVEFRYPTRPTVPVLRGLNIQVNPGQTVALVGSSGCGKSTSIQLLERFYDTLAGEVSVDGKDLKILNVQWLRAQLGLVSQEPVLFDCSIRDNIAYGDNSREVPMDEIIASARDANIHNFIEQLPEGYETNVGSKGTQLSGGQKQRIAIARALIRSPKILLLDEATSALDTESEKIVQEALDKAREGRTCIVIAHRLSTVQDADLIVVINNGQVVEQGTHGDLLAKKGFYYKLNTTQLQAT